MLSKNIEKTAEIAEGFFSKILRNKREDRRATVVCLSGGLGVGKTAFTQAIAKHLGVKNKIISPTFVIIKKYSIKNSKNYKFLFHLDAYRLGSEKELLYLDWEKIVGNKEHLVFIEWPENVKEIIPKNSHFIHISHAKNGHRDFQIKIMKNKEK